MARLIEMARKIDDSEGLPIAKPRKKKMSFVAHRHSTSTLATLKRTPSSTSIHGPLDINDKESPFGKNSNYY